ncbi:MAG: hypothetical protein ACQCN6_03490 [Candidatus Bathyarchaeia archaeon]|jgi:hypothetical protein
MKKGKKAPPPQDKKPHLSIKAYPEDAHLIEELQTTKNLSSQGEALHVLCNEYRGTEETDVQQCEYLCGEYCGKNADKIKKVTASYCQACKKSQRISQQEIDERTASMAEYLQKWKLRQEFFERLGVDTHKYHDENKWVEQANVILARLDAQFSELRQPSAEIANLKAELEKIPPLETDNAFLRAELDEIKQSPLAEKNAWITVENSKKDAEIKRLKEEIEQKDALIKTYMFHQGKIRDA